MFRRPVLIAPDVASRLFIGAGGPQLPAPGTPFVGKIEWVAIYRGESRTKTCPSTSTPETAPVAARAPDNRVNQER